MDVLLVLTALTVFVGVRTLGLVRSRRSRSGRRVIVAAALPPRPSAPRPSEVGGQAPVTGLPDHGGGGGQTVLPTRRSLRGSRSTAPPVLSTLAAPTGARRDDAGTGGTGRAVETGEVCWGRAHDTVGVPAAQLLPPAPRGRPHHPRRGERQRSSQGSAA